MNSKEILVKSRTYLGDTEGLIWTESELRKMLEIAARRYSEDTGCFRNRLVLCPDSNGKYKYPADYIHHIASWNKDEGKIDVISLRDLVVAYPDYSKVKGIPEYIYDELDSPDTFRLWPNPADLQALQNWDVEGDYGAVIEDASLYGSANAIVPYSIDDYGVEAKEYGIIEAGNSYGEVKKLTSYSFAGDYGLSADGYGEFTGTDSYGVFFGGSDFTYIGDMVYAAYGTADKVMDYNALIYSVLEQAYNTDADFGDAKKSAFYRRKYQERIARFGQIAFMNRGKLTGTRFF